MTVKEAVIKTDCFVFTAFFVWLKKPARAVNGEMKNLKLMSVRARNDSVRTENDLNKKSQVQCEDSIGCE